MSTSLSPRTKRETPSPDRFEPTRWSLVLAAAGDGARSSVARRALEELCAVYWRPLFGYIRRRGYAFAEAEDLTQDFFARLLAHEPFVGVGPEKGRLRSFLLASVQHFLANAWDRAQTLKRGGGREIISLDALAVEQGEIPLADPALPPEKAFDQLWAHTVLAQVLARLRAEFADRAAWFETLKPFLTGDAEPYAAIAARSGLSESALKVAVHRLRRRYRELLRAEIAQTVATPEEVEAEIRALFAALS